VAVVTLEGGGGILRKLKENWGMGGLKKKSQSVHFLLGERSSGIVEKVQQKAGDIHPDVTEKKIMYCLA